MQEYTTYLPKGEAEPVIESYYTTTDQRQQQQEGQVICRVCNETFQLADIR